MSRQGTRGGGRRGGGGERPSISHAAAGGRGRGAARDVASASSYSSPAAPPPSESHAAAGGRGRGEARDVASASSSSSPAAPPPSEALALEVQQKLTLQTPVQGPPSSSKDRKPPHRPGFGTVGRACLVRANHFLVQVAKNNSIYHYDVSISPEVLTRGLSRDIMKELVRQYGASHLGQRNPAYDGRKSLYAAGPLPFESKEFSVTLVDQDKKADARRKERVFKVAIRFASKRDVEHLLQFIKGRYSDMPHETVQALDIVMRQTPTSKYIPVGKSYFSANFNRPTPIGDGLECWRGFYQSIRPTQMGLSLNIDVAATVFHESLLVIDYVAGLLHNPDPRMEMNDRDRIKVKKALRGLRVSTTHSGGKRKYKISNITSLPMKHLKFPIDDKGNQNSVIKYFRERYSYDLKYVNWPCLEVGSNNKPTYLPMEVCQIVEGQHFSKKLNERQVSEILRAACQRPKLRQENIEKMVALNRYNEDIYAKEFGISVASGLASVEARVLPPPELMYFGSGPNSCCRPTVGAWNMINRKMVNGAKVVCWTCVSFSNADQGSVRMFVDELVGMCINVGMDFCRQPLVPISCGRPEEVDRVLKRVEEQCRTKLAGRKLQLLLIILPDRSGSYGLIKRVCETELGIVSQCCQPKHVRKIGKQYLENVALKINVKTGGRNTVLVDAVRRRIPLVSDYPTIIFGADVTHPPPGEDTSPSIAAVVASMDWPEVTKYRCLISAQKHRMEIIESLYTFDQGSQKHGGLIRDQLIAFRRLTGQKPHRIIFYRDGVSESQFVQVLSNEVDAIHKACQSLEETYLPPVTFIVVQKRHHTRIFPADHQNRNMTDRSGNILPGTVVDKVICHPTEFDFYLCSHAGIQGTSRPTHYHVLHDENKFTADVLQVLTNNLCYTYARCTRSVSIVPPAYYAHLGAARARYYMEAEMSDVGSSSGSTSRAGGGGDIRPLPQVKDEVRSVMFFC